MSRVKVHNFEIISFPRIFTSPFGSLLLQVPVKIPFPSLFIFHLHFAAEHVRPECTERNQPSSPALPTESPAPPFPQSPASRPFSHSGSTNLALPPPPSYPTYTHLARGERPRPDERKVSAPLSGERRS